MDPLKVLDPRRKLSRILAVGLVLAGLLWFPAWSPANARSKSREIEIRYVNGVYENLGSDLEPIRQGPLTIRISSPEHRLTIHSNRLRLVPNEDGTIAATMEIDFQGQGHLIAQVEGFGRFTDDVAAARQTVEAAGTVRLERAEDGYLFTVVEAQSDTRVEVESGVADQIVGACRAASRLPLVKLPCNGLDAALTSLRIPMPEAGRQFLLPSAEMTRKEKAFFNRLAPRR